MYKFNNYYIPHIHSHFHSISSYNYSFFDYFIGILFILLLVVFRWYLDEKK